MLDLLKQKGYHVTAQPVTKDRFNVLALTDDTPIVLLNSHMDTVLPFCEYSKTEEKIFGRGACDAKGQIVAMVEAGDRLRSKGIQNFGLLFVVGEELDSDGAKMAARLDLESRYVIIGEPTENKLVAGQKGTIVFRIQASGKGGHSCNPDNGDSAIHRLVQYMTQWLETDWGVDPVFGASTLNFGKISGGSGMNVIAPAASVEGIFRVSTSVNDIKNIINTIKTEKIRIEYLSESEPLHLYTVEGFEKSIVSFGTDASYLRPLGKILLYGPGSIDVAHCDDEYIRKSDLECGVQDLENIVGKLIKETSI